MGYHPYNIPNVYIRWERIEQGGIKVDHKLKYHMEKANLYGMLANYYEHIDPEKHIHYYKKHFYHEQKVVKYHKMGRKHMESSYSSHMCDEY